VKKNGRTTCRGDRNGDRQPHRQDLDRYWDGLIEGRSGARTVEGSTRRKSWPQSSPARCMDSIPQDYMDRKLHSEWRAFRSWPSPPPAWPSPTPAWILLRKTASVWRHMGTGIGGFIEMTTGAISYRDQGAPQPAVRADDHSQHGSRVGGDELFAFAAQHNGDHSVRASTHTLGDAARIIQHGDADVDAGGRRGGIAVRGGNHVLQFHSRPVNTQRCARKGEPALRPRSRWFRPRGGRRHAGARVHRPRHVAWGANLWRGPWFSP